MDPVKKHLEIEDELKDKETKKKLRNKVTRNTIIDRDLYKRTFTMPDLKCISEEDTVYTLKEMHEGVCVKHIGARATTYKLFRRGYYCPTM